MKPTGLQTDAETRRCSTAAYTRSSLNYGRLLYYLLSGQCFRKKASDFADGLATGFEVICFSSSFWEVNIAEVVGPQPAEA